MKRICGYKTDNSQGIGKPQRVRENDLLFAALGQNYKITKGCLLKPLSSRSIQVGRILSARHCGMVSCQPEVPWENVEADPGLLDAASSAQC